MWVQEVRRTVSTFGMSWYMCVSARVRKLKMLKSSYFVYGVVGTFLVFPRYKRVVNGYALECIGKLNLLKAQFCAFNTSDSTTIPLTVQNWQITS